MSAIQRLAISALAGLMAAISGARTGEAKTADSLADEFASVNKQSPHKRFSRFSPTLNIRGATTTRQVRPPSTFTIMDVEDKGKGKSAPLDVEYERQLVTLFDDYVQVDSKEATNEIEKSIDQKAYSERKLYTIAEQEEDETLSWVDIRRRVSFSHISDEEERQLGDSEDESAQLGYPSLQELGEIEDDDALEEMCANIFADMKPAPRPIKIPSFKRYPELENFRPRLPRTLPRFGRRRSELPGPRSLTSFFDTPLPATCITYRSRLRTTLTGYTFFEAKPTPGEGVLRGDKVLGKYRAENLSLLRRCWTSDEHDQAQTTGSSSIL